MTKLFDLTGRIAVITGGAGLLGQKHAEAIASQGGIPILIDLSEAEPETKARKIAEKFNVEATGRSVDITVPSKSMNCLRRYYHVTVAWIF